MLSSCLAWTNPQARQYDDAFTDNSKRDRGTRFHKAMEHILSGDTLYAVDKDIENLVEAALGYMDAMSSVWSQYQVEVAVGMSVLAADNGKAEVLPDVKDRNYPDWYGWAFGTADLVIHTKDGLVIADWKTGGSEGAKEQLLSLAYCFQKATGTRVDHVACLSVQEDSQGRAWVTPTFYPVQPGELEAHADKVREAYLRSQDAPGGPFPGIHCTTLYCPHLAFCGAIGNVVSDAAHGPEGKLATQAARHLYVMTDRPESDAHAGWIMERVSAAKRQLDYYTNAMKAYVNDGGKVASGGF
jgi:hypothetical protein